MSGTTNDGGVCGVLLAAGLGRRWREAGGQCNKLMHPWDGCTPLVVQAARALKDALPHAVAVVRPDAPEVAKALQGCGMRLLWADPALEGMGHSLAAAIRQTAPAHGWVITLGDMPSIQPDTIRHVAWALRAGHPLVAPFQGDRRGHPVGFGRAHGPALAALQGDVGARLLLNTLADRIHRLDVSDEGIHLDVDQPMAGLAH
ncbi:MAG: nucleotidyltransferase family protein [Rubrivivax sp.]|nr:MAG: nucleotidyltransferase family protein [Rubrivivax sp.]